MICHHNRNVSLMTPCETSKMKDQVWSSPQLPLNQHIGTFFQYILKLRYLSSAHYKYIF